MADELTIVDRGGDRSYFTMIPHIVHARCANVYEFTLWCVVKQVCGENGTCRLGTRELADLAMMSVGKCSQARQALHDSGLLIVRDVSEGGVTRKVCEIPDLWGDNLEWARGHNSLSERVSFKRDQKAGNNAGDEGQGCSPHEQGCSPHEQGCSPHERSLYNKDPYKEPSKNNDYSGQDKPLNFGNPAFQRRAKTSSQYARSRGARNSAMVVTEDGMSASEMRQIVDFLIDWSGQRALIDLDDEIGQAELKKMYGAVRALHRMGFSFDGVRDVCQKYSDHFPTGWSPTVSHLLKFASQMINERGLNDGRLRTDNGNGGIDIQYATVEADGSEGFSSDSFDF